VVLYEKFYLVLLGDVAGLAAGGLGALTAGAEAPKVAETAVAADLPPALEVVTGSDVDVVDEKVEVLTSLHVTLTVEEADGDVVLLGVLDAVNDALNLGLGELASTLVDVNVGADTASVGKATADTADGGEGVQNLLGTVHVSVQDTENVLEVLANDKGTRLSTVSVEEREERKMKSEKGKKTGEQLSSGTTA
jgi:hypothetical protein